MSQAPFRGCHSLAKLMDTWGYLGPPGLTLGWDNLGPPPACCGCLGTWGAIWGYVGAWCATWGHLKLPLLWELPGAAPLSQCVSLSVCLCFRSFSVCLCLCLSLYGRERVLATCDTHFGSARKLKKPSRASGLAILAGHVPDETHAGRRPLRMV